MGLALKCIGTFSHDELFKTDKGVKNMDPLGVCQACARRLILKVKRNAYESWNRKQMYNNSDPRTSWVLTGLVTLLSKKLEESAPKNCMGRTPLTDILLGMFKEEESHKFGAQGATSSFAGMAFESSLLFGVYSQMKQALQGEDRSSGRPKLQIVIPSAACGGALISFVLCPAELVKCRLQVQAKDSGTLPKHHLRYDGPLDCALKTVRKEGIQGLFRGGLATFLRESIGNAVFFSTYEMTRYYMLSTVGMQSKVNLEVDSQPSRFSNHTSKILIEAGVGVFSGGLGGIAFWSTVLPLDVAKTLIQTAPDINASRSPLHTLSLIYKDHGFRGFYAGLGPTLVRAFPANAAAIVTWELTANLLGYREDVSAIASRMMGA
eukprot:Gb_39174 [translate_table: standard]